MSDDSVWDKIETFCLLGYMALYATVGLQGLWEGYFSKGVRQLRPILRAEDASLPVFLLAIAAFPTGLAGMFLYAAGIQTWPLSYIWRGVLIILVLVFALERRQHYRHFLREPEPRLAADELEQVAVWYAAATAVIELPCLWMNFRVAFPA